MSAFSFFLGLPCFFKTKATPPMAANPSMTIPQLASSSGGQSPGQLANVSPAPQIPSLLQTPGVVPQSVGHITAFS